ncbi:MAG: hypothetical protein WAM69_02350 [Candidatus Sulfotelmatobacter sp.]
MSVQTLAPVDTQDLNIILTGGWIGNFSGLAIDLVMVLSYNGCTFEAASFERFGGKHAVDSTRF